MPTYMHLRDPLDPKKTLCGKRVERLLVARTLVLARSQTMPICPTCQEKAKSV